MKIINAGQIVIRSDKKSDVILEIVNRFRSVGVGSSEIIYMDLYPNQWDLVNKIRIFAGGDLLRVHVKW